MKEYATKLVLDKEKLSNENMNLKQELMSKMNLNNVKNCMQIINGNINSY